MSRRVVITAMGAVTSLGDDFQTIADSIRLERVRFRRCTSGDPIVVAPGADFEL